MSNKSVTVILPTFNEGGGIIRVIQAIAAHVPPGWNYEILVMDDNSPDGTYELVRTTFGADPHVVPVLRTADRGLAKSIRAGLERARSDWVVVMDSDYTHDPVEIPRLLHVAEIYDIVSGSRFCAGGRMVDTGHYLASMAYNWLLRLLIHTQVQDNLGGYYAAKRATLLALPLNEIFFGYGDYFFRLLHFAQKSGLSLVEIPAQYLMRVEGTSKSNWFRMFVSYSLAALRLKWRIVKLARDRAGPFR